MSISAGGYWADTNHFSFGSRCYSWSNKFFPSTSTAGNIPEGCVLSITSDKLQLAAMYLYIGYSIRPVRAKDDFSVRAISSSYIVESS